MCKREDCGTNICGPCAGQHSGSTVVFYHNQMIPAARGGMCSARLVPSTAAAGEKQRYRICTSTGDTPGNCLDHPAQVVLFGDGAVPPEDLESVMSPGGAPGPGRAGPFVLEVTDTGEQPFQRRAQNTFTVTVCTALCTHECRLHSHPGNLHCPSKRCRAPVPLGDRWDKHGSAKYLAPDAHGTFLGVLAGRLQVDGGCSTGRAKYVVTWCRERRCGA